MSYTNTHTTCSHTHTHTHTRTHARTHARTHTHIQKTNKSALFPRLSMHDLNKSFYNLIELHRWNEHRTILGCPMLFTLKMHMYRISKKHTYVRLYGVYTVFSAGKSPHYGHIRCWPTLHIKHRQVSQINIYTFRLKLKSNAAAWCCPRFAPTVPCTFALRVNPHLRSG